MMKLLPEALEASGGLESILPNEPDDIFIASASFEPRTRFATEHLASRYRAKRAVLYVNHELLGGLPGSLTKPNLYRLIERLAKHSDSVEVAEGSWLSDVEQIVAIRGALHFGEESVQSPERITLDCTTFNREALLTVLMLLRSQWPTCRVRVVYSAPDRYGEWLSRGYRTIRNVMGLCGTQVPSRPTVLAVLSGFEPHRTQKIIEEHEPSTLLLGVGDPPTSPEFWERNRLEQALMLSRPDVVHFRFAAGDIEQCRATLHGLLAQYAEAANTVVAPMSTKFSTIAALLVAEALPQVQLTYCLPGEYNIHDYSTGVKSVFLHELPIVREAV